MAVPKQLSVAQVSTKLQCAPSTVRKLVADGALRASRIGSRTIRISEPDLHDYLNGRANAPPAASADRLGRTITSDRLTALLAEHVMSWRVGPDRFLLGRRRWIPRWRFQPAEKLEDAFRLLEQVAPEEYTMGDDRNRGFWVRVRAAGVLGEATESSKARAITFAVARALGIDLRAHQ
jgi:excisionase family DNA binding protein